jgi:hypothetical protein
VSESRPPPLHLVGTRRDDDRWTLTFEAGGEAVGIDVVTAEAQPRPYRVVGDLAVSYRGGSAAGAAVADAVATLLDRHGSVAAVVAALAPAPRLLPADEAALPAFFDGAGSAVIDAAAPWTGPAEAVLPLWREARRLAASAGASLVGIPLCLGGAPGGRDVPPSGPCGLCADAPRCDHPPEGRDPEAVRPRVSDEPLVDVLSLWARLGLDRPEAVRAAVTLRRDGTAHSVYEVALTVAGGALGPARLTRYQEDGAVAPALSSFVALSGGAGEKIARTVADHADGLGCHAGFVDAGEGLLAKLYVTTDGLGPHEARGRLGDLLGALGPKIDLPPRAFCWLAIDLPAAGPPRLRLYEQTRKEDGDDPRADAGGTRSWAVTEAGLAEAPSARHAHYLQGHLPLAAAIDALEAPGDLAARLRTALSPGAARAYARIVSFGTAARVLYLHVGPFAPPPLAF